MHFRRDFLNIAAIGITAGVLMTVIFWPNDNLIGGPGPGVQGYRQLDQLLHLTIGGVQGRVALIGF